MNDLAAIKTAVSGQHEANYTYQRKQIKILTAEHFDAEYHRCQRAVGCTTEQPNQTERSTDSRIKAQQAAQNATEGSSDTEM